MVVMVVMVVVGVGCYLLGWWVGGLLVGEKEGKPSTFYRGRGTRELFLVGCDRMIEAYSLIDSEFLAVDLAYFCVFCVFCVFLSLLTLLNAVYPSTHRSRIRID